MKMNDRWRITMVIILIMPLKWETCYAETTVNSTSVQSAATASSPNISTANSTADIKQTAEGNMSTTEATESPTTARKTMTMDAASSSFTTLEETTISAIISTAASEPTSRPENAISTSMPQPLKQNQKHGYEGVEIVAGVSVAIVSLVIIGVIAYTAKFERPGQKIEKGQSKNETNGRRISETIPKVVVTSVK